MAATIDMLLEQIESEIEEANAASDSWESVPQVEKEVILLEFDDTIRGGISDLAAARGTLTAGQLRQYQMIAASLREMYPFLRRIYSQDYPAKLEPLLLDVEPAQA